jgi:hypothetical protein
MKTPKEYLAYLKENIVTEEMLMVSLYSVNKRAKNARDKEREYGKIARSWYSGFHSFDNEENARKTKEMYYELKTELLKFASPWLSSIHILEHEREKRRRIYDYQDEYNRVKQEDIVWSNRYFDDEEYCREVWFVDIIESRYKVYEYLLFYDFGTYSFHNPISEKEYLKIKDQIKVEHLTELRTEGKDINDLVSVQFVRKVLDVLKNGGDIIRNKNQDPDNNI